MSRRILPAARDRGAETEAAQTACEAVSRHASKVKEKAHIAAGFFVFTNRGIRLTRS
jgi:hypothetical protein